MGLKPMLFCWGAWRTYWEARCPFIDEFIPDWSPDFFLRVRQLLLTRLPGFNIFHLCFLVFLCCDWFSELLLRLAPVEFFQYSFDITNMKIKVHVWLNKRVLQGNSRCFILSDRAKRTTIGLCKQNFHGVYLMLWLGMSKDAKDVKSNRVT